MENLFLLDPTPQALMGMAASLRQSVYHRIVDLANETTEPPAERSGGRVQISTLDNMMRIAFARLQQRLVILTIGNAASVLKPELEEQVDALAHMGFAGLGLQIRDLPRESLYGIRVLDNATTFYCRAFSHAHPDHLQGIELIRRLTDMHTRVWGSSDARQNFKDVLDSAERDPQIIERGDRRFYVVEESRLPGLMGRKNAEEMYQHFFEDTEPVEPFERISGQPPGRLLNLG